MESKEMQVMGVSLAIGFITIAVSFFIWLIAVIAVVYTQGVIPGQPEAAAGVHVACAAYIVLQLLVRHHTCSIFSKNRCNQVTRETIVDVGITLFVWFLFWDLSLLVSLPILLFISARGVYRLRMNRVFMSRHRNVCVLVVR